MHDAPDDPEYALAWLLAIARRTLANHRRAGTRRLAATARLRAELVAAHGIRGGAHELPGGLDEVMQALAGLSDDDREVLTLTYWEGLTAEQVAVVLGARAATVRKRLERARRRAAAAIAAQRTRAAGRGRPNDPVDAVV